jgi:hypothetical protein
VNQNEIMIAEVLILEKELKSFFPHVRAQAADKLGSNYTLDQAAQAVQSLLKCALRDRNETVRAAAITSLGEMGYKFTPEEISKLENDRSVFVSDIFRIVQMLYYR